MSSTVTRTYGKKRLNYSSDSERSKRINANLIERRRMQNINTGFSSLKKLLPPSDRKQTKAAILQQASQHILRLQRAIIQFKTENDSLRNTLDMNNQALSCSKRACSSPQHFQYASKPHDVRNQKNTINHDYLCDTDLSGQRKPYERSLLPKPIHKKGDAGGWRMFEHVKKFKPSSSERSGFHNQLEVYHPHGIDPRPPTPPVSPPMEGHVLRMTSSTVVPATSMASLVPKFSLPSCRQTRPCYPPPREIPRQDLHLPKKNIFNSASQAFSTSRPARSEKRKSACQGGCMPEEGGVNTREGRHGHTLEPRADDETNRVNEAKQGDLQCIIDAIHIIESKECKCPSINT